MHAAQSWPRAGIRRPRRDPALRRPMLARQLAQPSAAGAGARVPFPCPFPGLFSGAHVYGFPMPKSFQHGDFAALHAQPLAAADLVVVAGQVQCAVNRPCAPNAPRPACHRAQLRGARPRAQITRSPSGSAIVSAACRACLDSRRCRKRQHVGGLVLATPAAGSARGSRSRATTRTAISRPSPLFAQGRRRPAVHARACRCPARVCRERDPASRPRARLIALSVGVCASYAFTMRCTSG